MKNLIVDDETEISSIEKPKRVMSEKTREALAIGRAKALEKKALNKTLNSIPEPILKKKILSKIEEEPVEKKPKAKSTTKKQTIVIQNESDSDDESPQIIIRTKSSKKDFPPSVQMPPPQIFEPEAAVEPTPIYRMRRI